MKYRKKAVVIEAVQVNEALHNAEKNWKALPAWLSEAYEKGGIVFERDGVSITTLEGTMKGDRGDWIIRGVKGELYPCKPDIFDATYDFADGALAPAPPVSNEFVAKGCEQFGVEAPATQNE